MADTATKADAVIPEQDDLMNAVLGQIYDKLTDGDGDTLESRDAFFAWATPGIPISDDQFDFMAGFTGADEAETARRWALAADFAAVVDFIPSPNGFISATDQQMVIANRRGTLSSEWERVLRTSQVADQPLTDDQNQRLEHLQGLLRTTRTEKDLISGEDRQVTEDSPLVKLYNEKQAAFELAALEFNSGRIDSLNNVEGAKARFGINGPILRRRVSACWDDWVAAGRKNEVDQIRATIALMTGRSMAAYRQRLIERFEMSKLASDQTGVEFNYIALAPAGILRAPGWTTFTFKSSDTKSTSSTKTNKWSAGGGFGIGKFSVGGKASRERTAITTSYDMTGFSLTFEMAQSWIRRAWLPEEYLLSRGWRFPPGGQPLSDGKQPPEVGTLPAYPETMILARNIHLDFAELHNSSSDIHTKLSASGGLGWGSLQLSGDYGREVHDKGMESSTDEQGIHVPGAQIIGYRCFEVPMSPNPDPDIPEEHWV
jgi:hypothetical protein